MSASALNFTDYLANGFTTTRDGKAYTAVCHRPSIAPHSASLSSRLSPSSIPEDKVEVSDEAKEGPCFTLQQAGARTFVQTLAFQPGARDEWVASLVGDQLAASVGAAPAPSSSSEHHHNHHAHHGRAPSLATSDENGIRFEVDAARLSGGALGAHGEHMPLGQMRNGKWVAYAVRALVLRFWDLAKVRFHIFILTECVLCTKCAIESRFTGHLAHPRWIHSHAHHLLPPPHSFPSSGFFLLAPFSYSLQCGTCYAHFAAYRHGYQDSHRSRSTHRGSSVLSMHSRLR